MQTLSTTSGLTAHQVARLDQAKALAATTSTLERRLRGFRARAAAAATDSPDWMIEVEHSSHDDLKAGRLVRSRSFVRLSKAEFPDALDAEATAYLLGQGRGTYPTRVSQL